MGHLVSQSSLELRPPAIPTDAHPCSAGGSPRRHRTHSQMLQDSPKKQPEINNEFVDT